MKWSEIRKGSKLTNERRAELDHQVLEESLERAVVTKIEQLRHARSLTQDQLAQQLGTNQGAISRLEHQSDLYLSTLQRFVHALGGRLEIVVKFKDAEPIELDLFGDIAAPQREPELARA
jgi:transcriptional regulator with XRE-family HTH domain